MRDAKEFYEGYWKYRKSIGRLHTIEGDGWIPERLTIATRMIQMPHDHLRVLDVGCGEGTLGMLLRKQWGDRVYLIGCDLSEEALDLASPHYNETHQVDIELDDLQKCLGKEAIDYIVSLEVLEHLARPEVALGQYRPLLSKAGSIIASFPNVAWWRNRLYLLRGYYLEETLYHPSEHIQNFTLHTFTALLEQTGFRSEALDAEFRGPYRLRRILPSVQNRIMRKYPALFGHQIVVRAVPL